MIQVASLIKAHCLLEYDETVFIHRLVNQGGQWDATVQAYGLGHLYGPQFGLIVSLEGEVLEDALDTDDE